MSDPVSSRYRCNFCGHVGPRSDFRRLVDEFGSHLACLRCGQGDVEREE